MNNFKEGMWRAWMFSSVFAVGLTLGYQWPRDLELASTAPVEISYEITPEAARLLVVRSVSGLPECRP